MGTSCQVGHVSSGTTCQCPARPAAPCSANAVTGHPRASEKGSRMDLLITNARVWDDRPPVDIAVEGERIAAIDERIDAEAGRTIDAGGRAVVPAFVEPHLHLDKALLYRRRPAREGTLEEAIRITGQLKA